MPEKAVDQQEVLITSQAQSGVFAGRRSSTSSASIVRHSFKSTRLLRPRNGKRRVVSIAEYKEILGAALFSSSA